MRSPQERPRWGQRQGGVRVITALPDSRGGCPHMGRGGALHQHFLWGWCRRGTAELADAFVYFSVLAG